MSGPLHLFPWKGRWDDLLEAPTLTQKVDNDDVDRGLVNNNPMPHGRHKQGLKCKGVLSNGL